MKKQRPDPAPGAVLDRSHIVYRPPDDWRAQAACKDMDTDIFFPVQGEVAKISAALAVCKLCAVRAACLADGLAQPTSADHGIWGGTTTEDRRGWRNNPGQPGGGTAHRRTIDIDTLHEIIAAADLRRAERQCRSCRLTKPVIDYPRGSGGRTGKECRDCMAARTRPYYHARRRRQEEEAAT